MDYEYAPLRISRQVDRRTVAVQLGIAAEYAGWELAKVRLLRDGTRQIVLRRRADGGAEPGGSGAARPALGY